MKLHLTRMGVKRFLNKKTLPKERVENNFLRVYQIFYTFQQLQAMREFYSDYIPFENSDCTVFFENEVMQTLVKENKHIGVEYFGVVSHKLREKLGFTMKEKWAKIPNIANHSTEEFTPAKFEMELRKGTPDIMSFQRHMPHDPIKQAERFHPRFTKFWTYIMKEIGYNWEPTNFENVFYCNFFVARPEIYQKFVEEMLSPAMLVMKEMPELMENSCYPHKLPQNLVEKFKINHYPYHPFICERMFSYFVHLHNYKSLHY